MYVIMIVVFLTCYILALIFSKKLRLFIKEFTRDNSLPEIVFHLLVLAGAFMWFISIFIIICFISIHLDR